MPRFILTQMLLEAKLSPIESHDESMNPVILSGCKLRIPIGREWERNASVQELSEASNQPIQKHNLALKDSRSGIAQGKPIGAVHLRKFLLAAGLGGPLHRKGVTSDPFGRAVPFDGPGTNYFSTRLLHLIKGNEFSCGFDSCFLFELSLRRIEWIFLFPIFTFGYRPCSGVLIFPKGSSRMDEEYL